MKYHPFRPSSPPTLPLPPDVLDHGTSIQDSQHLARHLDVANPTLSLPFPRYEVSALQPFPVDAAHVETVIEPYLMGFNHSRPDEKHAFTDGPIPDPTLLDYQHPQYLKGHLRYKPEFDYFSLGLVLLELGLWKTLRSQTKKLPLGSGPEELYDLAVHQLVPKLGVPMGSRYQAVVRFGMEGIMLLTKQAKPRILSSFNYGLRRWWSDS